MVHLSKRKLEKTDLIKLFKLFYEILNKSEDADDFLELAKDVLSPPEQIMIAKRIAIIYLLIKKVGTKDIVDYLKVSGSTVTKFNLLFWEKESRIIKVFKQTIRREKVKNMLTDILADFYIQPGLKIGHHQMAWEHKKRKEERKMIDV